jgi:hypothetical protein
MYPSQLCHSAIVEVAPIRYPSAMELLRMKLGFGYFKFPDDPSRNIFHLAEPSVYVGHMVRAHTQNAVPKPGAFLRVQGTYS